MNVYKIGDAVADQYHGAGYVLAAMAGGQVVRLVYLADVLSDFDAETDSLAAAVNDERLAPTVRELSALGEVCVGMCSCWEFVEL